MAAPYLLALTPRAGVKNHRYLVSPGAGLDEEAAVSALAGAFRDAGDRDEAWGRRYLAVRRRAAQVEGGRVGDEVLLLGGIDAARLRPEGRARLLGWLRGRLDELGPLVGRIDWEARRDLVTERAELAEWLDSAEGLPAARRPLLRLLLLLTGVFLVAVTAVAVTARVCAVVATWSGQGKGEPPPRGPAKGGPEGKDRRFDEALNSWGIEPKDRQDALLDLYAIVHGNQPPGPKKDILDDPECKAVFNAAFKENSLFVPQVAQRGTLRLDFKEKKAGDVRGHRELLWRLERELVAFGLETRGLAIPSLQGYEELQAVAALAELARQRCTGTRPRPVLPIFSQTDEDLTAALYEWEKKPPRDNAPQTGLAQLIARLQGRRVGLAREADEARRRYKNGDDKQAVQAVINLEISYRDMVRALGRSAREE
jgi:hypothetical protein